MPSKLATSLEIPNSGLVPGKGRLEIRNGRESLLHALFPYRITLESRLAICLAHTLTPRGLASLEVLLWEFQWKASDPSRRYHPLMTEVTLGWENPYPTSILFSIIFNGRTKIPVHTMNYHFNMPLVLFGTTSGCFFRLDWAMMTVGTDL